MSWLLAAVLLLPMSACKQGENCAGVGAFCSTQTSSAGTTCCSPYTCSREGICAPAGDIVVPCQQRGWRCGSTGDCCGTLTCSAGICDDGIRCGGRGANCGSSGQCCAQYTCRSGFCQ